MADAQTEVAKQHLSVLERAETLANAVVSQPTHVPIWVSPREHGSAVWPWKGRR